MTAESVATVAKPADVGLKREMGLIGAIWSSETSLIGSGWLFGALYASQVAGPAALISWVVAGIVVIILALVHAELGGMYPVAGGTARFPHFAFGSVAGISFGFFSWLQAVCVAPIECFAVMQYGQYWFGPNSIWKIEIYNTASKITTGPGFVFTIILMAIFTLINFLGMRHFSKVNSAITWWKVAIPVLAIIVLLTKFHASNFSAGGGFMHAGLENVFSAMPTAGVVFAYLGFEQADQLAGEIKEPQKNLPRAIIGSILIAVVVYCMLQVVFIAAMPSSVIAHGFSGITNTTILDGPFAGLLGLVGFGFIATILRIDAFISPFGTGMLYQTSTSRVGYGLARNRYYPQFFGKTNSQGVPWISLILAFLLGLLFLLPFPSWKSLVNLVTSASVLMYAGAPLALGAFRRQVPEASRPYRMPGAAVLSPLAFIFACEIIYFSGFDTVWKLGICIVIGYVLIGVFMAFDKNRPPLDWRSAQWLPVFLIGMGIVSWQGRYCSSGLAKVAGASCTAANRIPFWWDMGIIAVFALVIYFWAQAVRLPKQEMLELVERQSTEQEPEATPA